MRIALIVLSQVNGTDIVLRESLQDHQSNTTLNPPVGVSEVHLQLEPVAARWLLHDTADARLLCRHMLETLYAVHKLGFVHRDVREDNILRTGEGFILIDWEMAGTIDDLVFWQPAVAHVPKGVTTGTPWKPWMDLWQLGNVLRSQPIVRSSQPCTEFITKLLNKEIETAERALQALWT